MRKIITVTVAFVALAACDLVIGPHILTQFEQMTVEISARRYAEPINARFAGCFPNDLNGNGFVTCTIALPETRERVELLCSYLTSKIGCKRK